MKILCKYTYVLFITTALIMSNVLFAQSTQIFKTNWEPVEAFGFNGCSGESYIVDALHYSQVQTTEDGSGGTHIKVIDRIRGTAVGVTTGTKYLDAGEGVVFIEHLTNFSGTYVSTFQLNGTLISMDKNVSSIRYRIISHVTLDANGNLTSSVDNFEVICS